MARQLNPETGQESNLLHDLHSSIIHMAAFLRNKICEEFGWDPTTYNRKCREKPKRGKSYSEAEKLIIMTAYMQTLQIAFDQVEKQKKALQK